MKLLGKNYYTANDTTYIAKDLLGKILVSTVDGEVTSGVIVETEAYLAPEDQASHAKNFKKTPKNITMYAQGGTAYVYKCYGIHDLLNVVTGPEGQAHAILIRAIEPYVGLDTMQARRNMKRNDHQLTGGPGKVSRALGIDTLSDGLLYFDESSALGIYRNTDKKIDQSQITCGPRVGMSIHTGMWAHTPLRFYIKGNKWVSKPLIVKYPDSWV